MARQTSLLADPCSCSVEDCARYIEALRQLEGRPADTLKVRQEETHLAQVSAVLTAAKGGVNKTDALTLIATFGVCPSFALTGL